MREFGGRSLCHALLIDARPRELHASDTVIHRLEINGPRPVLSDTVSEPVLLESDDPMEDWTSVLHELLQQWI